MTAGGPAIHIKAPAAAAAEIAGAARDIARPVTLADIPVRIAHAAADGVDRLRIVLDPPELGRVDVKIAFDDGRISAALLVDRPETLDLLQRDSRALERTLNEAGFKTDSDSLDFNLRGHRHGQRDGMPENGHARREDDRGRGEPLADVRRMLDAAAAQAWRPHRLGGLDIRA
jgi:flagellar hook-length control protein FliK